MKRTWLADIRNNLNMTHQDVADKINVSRQYYGMIENGERDPSVSTAKKIANTLEFDWTIFFDSQSYKTFHQEKAI